MNTKSIVAETISALESLKDDNRKKMGERNFPTKLEILGVTSPNIKLVLEELRSQTKDWSTPNKKTLAIALTDTRYHECHHLAYYYLEKEKKALYSLTIQEAEQLAACLDNWVLVDTYCTFILGVLWRIGTISDDYIISLAKDKDLWNCRCAVVSTVALNQASRGGKGDTKRTIQICEIVISDHKSLIVKALSWALRVLISRDRLAVEQFLSKYENKLHNQVKKEVQNKLQTGRKNPNP